MNISSRALRAAAAIAVATNAVACDDAIHRGWLVDRTRVIAARAEATAEPERASLVPGESARVTWLVSAPEGTPNVASAFAVCIPPAGNFAEPRCLTPVLVSGAGSSAGELVAVDFDVPPAEELGDAKELLVLMAFCEDGTPELDAETFTATCASGDALLASLVVRLASAGTNLNPPFSALRLGDTILPGDTETAAGAPCDEAPDAPKLAAGGPEVDLVYEFDGSEREAGESILLSTLVTDGELDRQYSGFEPEERAPKEARVAWTPPANVGSAGRIVRFYAVLRDGRGGASFGRFLLCVGPS